MTSHPIRRIGGLAALALAVLLPAAAEAAPVKLHADLIGAPEIGPVLGSLDYQSSDHDTRRKIHVSIHDEHYSNAANLLINGAVVATVYLDANGDGTAFVSTRRGDSVPDLSPGQEVEVVDYYTSRILLFGFIEEE